MARYTPLDTDPVVYEVQMDRLRAMTLAERIALIEAMHADVEAFAVAGIRTSQPDLTDEQIDHELARRRYGNALADAAFAHRCR